MEYALLCLVGIFTMMFLRNFLNWVFSMENYFVHKKRLKQLKFKDKKETNVSDLIDQIGSPTRKYLLPRLKFDEEEIQKKLEFSGWNKYFTVKSFISFDITLKIIGVTLFIVMCLTGNAVVGVIWGVVLLFLLNFLLDNTIDAKKERLYTYFPDFLRISSGFLSSGMPFLKAIERTLVYLNEEWQELLKEFIVDANLYNIETALNRLKEKTNMFEVKEFVTLVKLVIEQGGEIKEGFAAQAESIIEMQQFILEKKIAKRKTLTILVQAPMMIVLFATFGLPIIGNMTSVGII